MIHRQLKGPENEATVREIAQKEARKHGINPDLVMALIHQESTGDELALSPKGAIGAMQVMAYNAKRCGMKPAELIDKKKNIACGTQIFAEELRAASGDPVVALRRYNGGPKCAGGGCRESEGHWRGVFRALVRHG